MELARIPLICFLIPRLFSRQFVSLSCTSSTTRIRLGFVEDMGTRKKYISLRRGGIEFLLFLSGPARATSLRWDAFKSKSHDAVPVCANQKPEAHLNPVDGFRSESEDRLPFPFVKGRSLQIKAAERRCTPNPNKLRGPTQTDDRQPETRLHWKQP